MNELEELKKENEYLKKQESVFIKAFDAINDFMNDIYKKNKALEREYRKNSEEFKESQKKC